MHKNALKIQWKAPRNPPPTHPFFMATALVYNYTYTLYIV